jgi:hypothetical protein
MAQAYEAFFVDQWRQLSVHDRYGLALARTVKYRAWVGRNTKNLHYSAYHQDVTLSSNMQDNVGSTFTKLCTIEWCIFATDDYYELTSVLESSS